MTSDKKLELKRLIIYLLLAFAPPCIGVPILNKAMDGLIFSEELSASPVTALVVLLGMMCPATANILTRIITKEGFKNSFLRATFKGNMKYYVFAVIIPVAYGLTGAVILRLVYGAAAENDLSVIAKIAVVISQIGVGIVMAFAGFGEEFGWRGYMMPKLEKLIGFPASILVGGIIWGLWHAPLTCSGHNFGTDYPGFPFVGIGLMCVMCTLMNSILTYVTKKTNSVYPASILHMVNNNTLPIFLALLVSAVSYSGNVFAIVYTFIPMGLIAAVLFVMQLKSVKPKLSK